MIRIRGWHTTQKKMYSPEEMAADQLTLLPTGQFINVSGLSVRLSEIYPVDKFIPLQSTQLNDCEGNEIFEGDILEWWNKIENKKWVVKRTAGGWNPFIDDCTTDHSYHYKVIGNIYQNPELLNQK